MRDVSPAASQSSSTTAAAAAVSSNSEDLRLELSVQQQPPPTSVEGFRKHHIYCLEQFLGKYEMLHPRIVSGLFKGKPYFLRCAVQTLLTKTSWRKQGRRVLEAELGKPAKVVERKDRADLSVYGEWQTQQHVAALLVDGVVPKNEHGNIEIWSSADIPENAQHIRTPRMSRVAKSLGISYAPALIGFEVRRGITHPVIEGIVVAKNSVGLLNEAYAMLQQQKLEKAIVHNRNLVYKRWKRLITGIRLRRRLQHDYGPY